jgi:hypothetical protein
MDKIEFLKDLRVVWDTRRILLKKLWYVSHFSFFYTRANFSLETIYFGNLYIDSLTLEIFDPRVCGFV